MSRKNIIKHYQNKTHVNGQLYVIESLIAKLNLKKNDYDLPCDY